MSPYSSGELVSIVMPKVHEGLLRRNWQKRVIHRDYVVTLGSEAIGTVHFGWVASRTEPLLELNALVGVRNQALERKLAEIMREEFDPRGPGTIVKQLGYLMPEPRFVQWRFTYDMEIRAGVEDLLAALERYAVPFMRENGMLEAITKSMQPEEFFMDTLHWFRLSSRLPSTRKTYEGYEIGRLLRA